MNSKIIAAVAVLVIVVAAIGVYIATDNGGDKVQDDRETITVTDVAGRQVEVKFPVEKVALGGTEVVDLFAATVGDGWEDYVCMMPADMDGSLTGSQAREPQKAELIYSMYPELAELPKCPDMYMALQQATLNLDSILESGADVIILPYATLSYFPDQLDNIVKTLESGGVAVYFTDFYGGTFSLEDAGNNFDGLGVMMGCEERTDRIVTWYNDAIKTVTDRIAAMPESEKGKTVMYEVTMGDGTTYGRIMGMGLPDVDAVGAVSVADGAPGGVITDWTADDLMAANPDAIVIACSAYFGSTSEQLFGFGVEISEQDLEALAAPYLGRDSSVLEETTAYKNGAIQFRYGELRNTPAGVYDLYATAELLYPEEFDDLDPKAVVDEYYELFMPWSFEGNWSYNLL